MSEKLFKKLRKLEREKHNLIREYLQTWYTNSITQLFLEDNNGGDIIELKKWGDNHFELIVGRCCVVVLKLEGTITDICDAISELAIKASNETESITTTVG